MQPSDPCAFNWTEEDVGFWLSKTKLSYAVDIFNQHRIDGKALLLLTENDVEYMVSKNPIGLAKKLFLQIQQLKLDNKQMLVDKGLDPNSLLHMPNKVSLRSTGLGNVVENNEYYKRLNSKTEAIDPLSIMNPCNGDYVTVRDNSYQSSRSSEDGHTISLKPEFTKAVIALAYLFLVTWITSFVMVIVHDRVPDMKRYPPLPDIFLDNVPYIPWAFHMCEWTATVLLVIWLVVLLFHKYRFILLRRFFALCGTVFLLRCITMLITSLSVPGSHLKCSPRLSTYTSEYLLGDIVAKVAQAYTIWRNAGLSIRGVRTCGDYMFSGHSVVLTMLNFFITEYTPRDLHLLHIFTWILNMFGIFFILSGHEHYSIDVFIAFYITSRLFLYYHTLANNQALMQRDSTRTRIWFPLFSFFESSIEGIVPNEYETPAEIIENLFMCGKNICGHVLHMKTITLEKFYEMKIRSNRSASSRRHSHKQRSKKHKS
ncbi:sphingomyelin synthase-related protein 1-like [Planococcus citri]|uniref:sphingomyelin synthase-related protein 1-like n=1 Tax=Planococcus citri TaxID=170843 RepID=UPI0031F934D3